MQLHPKMEPGWQHRKVTSRVFCKKSHLLHYYHFFCVPLPCIELEIKNKMFTKQLCDAPFHLTYMLICNAWPSKICGDCDSSSSSLCLSVLYL